MYSDYEVYLCLYSGQGWTQVQRHTVLLSICSSLIMYLYRCFFNGCTFLHLFLLTHLPESGMTTNDKPVVYTTVYFLRKINLPNKFNRPMNLLKVLLMRLNSNENYLGMWSLQQNIPISTTLNLILSSKPELDILWENLKS